VTIRKVALVLAGLAVIAVPLGCSDPESGFKPDPNAGKSNAQRQQETLDAIKNNPNMNEDQKQIAMQSIQGHAGQVKKK